MQNSKLFFVGVRVNENVQFCEIYAKTLILAAELQGFLGIEQNTDFREGRIEICDSDEVYEKKRNSDVWSQIEIYEKLPLPY